jgi:hypothetical protein
MTWVKNEGAAPAAPLPLPKRATAWRLTRLAPDWTGASADELGLSIAVPGRPECDTKPIVARNDIEWDVRFAPDDVADVVVYARHIPPTSGVTAETAVAELARLHVLGEYHPLDARLDPMWGGVSVVRGQSFVELPVMGNPNAPKKRRVDHVLAVGRPDGGVVLVQVMIGSNAPPTMSAFLTEVFNSLRVAPTGPVPPLPPSLFITQDRTPTLPPERLAELGGVISALAREPQPVRDAIVRAWAPLAWRELERPWDAPAEIPEGARDPSLPAWVRDRNEAMLAHCRTMRDVCGLAIAWSRAVKAASLPDDGALYVAPGTMALRPEAEAEVPVIAARWKASFTPGDRDHLASFLKPFLMSGDAPTDPVIPQLLQLLRMQLEGVGPPEVQARITRDLAALKIIRDLQGMTVWWLAVISRMQSA